MTAVIYARYSSDNQHEESIEGQIRECTAYAEKKKKKTVSRSSNTTLIVHSPPKQTIARSSSR